MRLSFLLPAALAALLTIGTARVAPAQAGDPGEKTATSPDKTPPTPGELKSLRTIDKDRNPALGSMEGGPHVLAFSPDGTMLGVGNQDGAVSIVDLGADDAAAPKWRRLCAHEGAANAIAFLQRGERGLLASVGDDGNLNVAPVDSGTDSDRKDPVFSRPLAIGPLSALAVLSAGPETPRLVVGSVHGGLVIVSISDQISVETTIEATAPRDQAIVGLVALSATKLAIANWDGTVRTVELPSGKELRAMKVSPLELTSLSGSADHNTLAVGGWHAGIALLDASSLKTLATAEPHPGVANSVILVGSGPVKSLRLVTASIHDECIAVSDPWKDTLAASRHTKIKGTPSAIALSVDLKKVACANFDGGIEIFKMPRSGEPKADAKEDDK